jgi:hypothetical protein
LRIAAFPEVRAATAGPECRSAYWHISHTFVGRLIIIVAALMIPFTECAPSIRFSASHRLRLLREMWGILLSDLANVRAHAPRAR